MLDANEQAKGGFGAFAARERERKDGRPAVSAEQVDGTPGTAPAASATPASETPASEPPANAGQATAAPTGRQPKRWR